MLTITLSVWFVALKRADFCEHVNAHCQAVVLLLLGGGLLLGRGLLRRLLGCGFLGSRLLSSSLLLGALGLLGLGLLGLLLLGLSGELVRSLDLGEDTLLGHVLQGLPM